MELVFRFEVGVLYFLQNFFWWKIEYFPSCFWFCGVVSCLFIKTEFMELPSRFKIGEDVDFTLAGGQVGMRGEVVAVRFTKAKVFYDIVDDCACDIHRDIDSCDVTPEGTSLSSPKVE